jgi:hypothetical protein
MARRGAPDPAPIDLRKSVETAADVTSADWPGQMADLIEQLVGWVRDNTTTKAILVARVIVYAALALIVVPAIVTLVLVTAIRILNAYLPDSVFGEHHIWAAYLILGLPFAIGGWLCIQKARRGAARLRVER